MNLKHFNTDDMAGGRKGEPTICINTKGKIALSKAAIDLTGYAADDEIGLSQDQDNKEDWYLNLVERGFKLCENGGKSGLHVYCAMLCKSILDSLKLNHESVTFRIAKEPVVVNEVPYWPLITSNPIINDK